MVSIRVFPAQWMTFDGSRYWPVWPAGLKEGATQDEIEEYTRNNPILLPKDPIVNISLFIIVLFGGRWMDNQDAIAGAELSRDASSIQGGTQVGSGYADHVLTRFRVMVQEERIRVRAKIVFQGGIELPVRLHYVAQPEPGPGPEPGLGPSPDPEPDPGPEPGPIPDTDVFEEIRRLAEKIIELTRV